MNQVTNEKDYGLLSPEEQAGYCLKAKKRRMYECYILDGKWRPGVSTWFSKGLTYRLKMVPGEIYYCEYSLTNGKVFRALFEYTDVDGYLTNCSRYVNLEEGIVFPFRAYLSHDDNILVLRPATGSENKQFKEAFAPKVCSKCKHNPCEYICPEQQFEKEPKKEKWYYWYYAMDKKKPKKGTYKDVSMLRTDGIDTNWMPQDKPKFKSKEDMYRYHKVKVGTSCG